MMSRQNYHDALNTANMAAGGGSVASFEVRPIGRVESALHDLKAAPKQADEGAPSAWLVLAPEVGPALQGIAVGDEVVLFNWLDRDDRKVLTVHPLGDTSKAQQGV